jgi:hypothetical protein
LDNDGMLDNWEARHGLDTNTNDAALDPDKDGLTNIQEFQVRTNPKDQDADGDELPDKWETDHQLDSKVGTGSNGADGDPDHETLVNLDEFLHNTDPNDADSDNKIRRDRNHQILLATAVGFKSVSPD